MAKQNAADWARAGFVGALAWGFVFGAGAARAGDDGAAPLWVGIGSIFGMKNNDNQALIHYRERGRIVLPPKMDLPPPKTASANSDWPADQEVVRARALRADRNLPSPYRSANMRRPSSLNATGAAMVSATSGAGPGGGACLKDGHVTPCPDAGAAAPAGKEMNLNPLSWIGLQKKPMTVLGPEPPREFLTDPPKGFREPVEGVGAKVQTE